MPADLDLLCRVEDRWTDDSDVTWRMRADSKKTYRLWSTEYDYEVVTPRALRLLDAGLVEHTSGWKYTVGGLKLTPAGRAALKMAGRYTGTL